MIQGVELKSLVTNTDERGFFRELIRVNDPIFKEGFGQWSHTLTHQLAPESVAYSSSAGRLVVCAYRRGESCHVRYA